MVLQCINGVSWNPIEGRTKSCQIKDLILTLFSLIFRPIYMNLWLYLRVCPLQTFFPNKTCVLQTTGGKDEPNIVFFCGNRNGYPNTELTSVLTNSVILLGVHNALRILFPNYYPLANEVAKRYGNATVCPSVRPSITSLWTL